MSLQHSPSIVTNGLLWCLDAGNKRSYPGSGTSWSDLSGNGRTTTLRNGPTFSSSNGGILTFDGVNDLAAGPADLKWTPDGSVGYSALTIELWLRTSDTTGYFYGKPWNSNGVYNIVFNLNGTFSFTSFSSAAGQFFPTTINDGNWKQIVVWVNSTQFGSYVNGTNFVRAAANHGLTGGVPTTGGGDVNLPSTLMCLFPYNEGNPGNAALFCAGDMASVKVYNRVLTQSEVRQNFNALRGRFGI